MHDNVAFARFPRPIGASLILSIASQYRMRFVNVLALLALGIAPSAAAQDGAAGRYRLVGEQDVASELILRKDGSFEYFLMAGSLDEHAKGKWTANGARLYLETLPIPKPAVFVMGAGSTSTTAPLTVNVRWPDGRGIAGIDVEIGFDAGDVLTDYTQEYGWSLSADEARRPLWIKLKVPMYQLVSERLAIDTAISNALSFTLVPNDLGALDFRNYLIEVLPGRLVVNRDGSRLIYTK